MFFVLPVGLEPTTPWLKARYSTIKLRKHYCLWHLPSSTLSSRLRFRFMFVMFYLLDLLVLKSFLKKSYERYTRNLGSRHCALAGFGIIDVAHSSCKPVPSTFRHLAVNPAAYAISCKAPNAAHFGSAYTSGRPPGLVGLVYYKAPIRTTLWNFQWLSKPEVSAYHQGKFATFPRIQFQLPVL